MFNYERVFVCTFYSDRPLSMGDIWGLEYNIVKY